MKSFIKNIIYIVLTLYIFFIAAIGIFLVADKNLPFEWYDKILIMVAILIVILVQSVPIIYLLRIYSGKSRKDKKLEKETKGPDYYREIMHEKSPLLMAYLYHKRILKTDVMAHLNYLARKKIISIVDGKIMVLENPTYEEDIYILNHIDQLNTISLLQDLKRMMKKRAEQDGYLQTNYKGRMIALLIALFIFISKVPLLYICILIGLFGSICIPIIYFFTTNGKDTLYYTKTGYETLNKLNALKRFLEDFGVMENKTSDDIILYEDYIVYGIILECSKSLMDHAKNDWNLIIRNGNH